MTHSPESYAELAEYCTKKMGWNEVEFWYFTPEEEKIFKANWNPCENKEQAFVILDEWLDYVITKEYDDGWTTYRVKVKEAYQNEWMGEASSDVLAYCIVKACVEGWKQIDKRQLYSQLHDKQIISTQNLCKKFGIDFGENND